LIFTSKLTTGFVLLSCLVLSCKRQAEPIPGSFEIYDPNLNLELITDDISTPIGMVVDGDDHLYVLESHTHTPPDDYSGPGYDRIKKAVDQDQDGRPDQWIIYADSIEDGMNLTLSAENILFLTTKDAVYSFQDLDGDGVSDRRQLLLDMIKPASPYDHAAILGLAVSPDNQWLFVSRGNTGSDYWVIEGTDGSQISGYGDGGNVMRCRLDGSQLEEVATGFWNPFDIKFTLDGRLLLTDNDPDSRGPNRLIELIPGGDYGYKSLYGGSGIHPFVAWNGELPGTLPYAAPLGEAACALLDAGTTNFGTTYQNSILANIWEEKNIVQIPMSKTGSTIVGTPKVLVQGDSTFHPVALTTNSRGDLFISDWVLREYPNHGQGRIWRLSSNQPLESKPVATMENYRFNPVATSWDQNLSRLVKGDEFEKTVIRNHLAKSGDIDNLKELLSNPNPELRLQGLLTFFHISEKLTVEDLTPLLADDQESIRQTTLKYIGSHQISEMKSAVEASLQQGFITAELFGSYLATMQNLQPDFLQGYQQKEEKSNKLKRKVPEGFIENIVTDQNLDQTIRGLALPYLENLSQKHELLLTQLESASDASLQLALIDAIRSVIYSFPNDSKVNQLLLKVAADPNNSDRVRANALAAMPKTDQSGTEQVFGLLADSGPTLKYAALKFLLTYAPDYQSKLADWINQNKSGLSATALSVWERNSNGPKQSTVEQYDQAVDGGGIVGIGELVFKAPASVCQSCHQLNGWGGIIGPDLSNIGSSKNQQLLTSAVLYPSQEMAPEWQGWYVIDAEGNKHTGRQIDVHLYRVELMNVQGEFDGYKDVRSFGVLDESLMPAGLQNSMTLQEFNDLIAYLGSLK